MCLLKEVIYVMHPVIFLIITIGIQKCSSAYYSVSTKPGNNKYIDFRLLYERYGIAKTKSLLVWLILVGLLSPKSVRISEVPAVTLLVEVPMSSVQYVCYLDIYFLILQSLKFTTILIDSKTYQGKADGRQSRSEILFGNADGALCLFECRAFTVTSCQSCILDAEHVSSKPHVLFLTRKI